MELAQALGVCATRVPRAPAPAPGCVLPISNLCANADFFFILRAGHDTCTT